MKEERIYLNAIVNRLELKISSNYLSLSEFPIKFKTMSTIPPFSGQKPDKQLSKTHSGKKITMAMSLMIDSMVKMIQGANHNHAESSHQKIEDGINED